MSRKVYYKEKFDDLVMGAKAELTDLIKDMLTKIDTGCIEFSDYKITTPIFKESADDNNDVIVSTFIIGGEIKFMVSDDYHNSYELSINDIDMDMTLYLLGQFEWFELTYRYEKQYGGKQ